MTVHDIGEARAATRREASAPKRHYNWRRDWDRALYWPEYESGDGRWNIFALTMLAVHEPSRAVFELEYDRAHLLYRVKFLPHHSKAPSCDWQPKGPEMRELISQIAELYIHRW